MCELNVIIFIKLVNNFVLIAITQCNENLMNFCISPFSVPGEPCNIDPDNDKHEIYLSEFKSMVLAKMRISIDKDLVNDPDVIKGRKKTVQVCLR